MAGKKQNKASMWKKLMKNVDPDEPTSFVDHEYLGCTQRECKPNEALIERCTKKWLNHVFLLEQQKSYGDGTNLTQKPSRGPTTWKDMFENALSDIASWQTKKWSKTKVQVLAWMIINSSRKNSNQLENCQKFADKLSLNPCIWRELVDPTFYGHSIKLLDESPNGHKLVTDVWQDINFTFITQMTAVIIVMWVTRLSIANWVISRLKFCWRF